ncbi:MAG: hypothetical protein JRE40_04645 [Deltaproteobacteria bacterium]|nr:hypothetical protein [Deltaproteobacteria bacterium]
MGELSEVLKEQIVGEPTKVESIAVEPASSIFGKSARNPDRQMIRITCENGANVVTALPQGVVYDGERWHVEDHAAAARSLRNPKSKLAAWMRRYGDEPHVGQEVSTYLDEQGFMRVEL